MFFWCLASGVRKKKGRDGIEGLHFHYCTTTSTKLSNFMRYYYLILESALNHNNFILTKRPFDQVLTIYTEHMVSQVINATVVKQFMLVSCAEYPVNPFDLI